MVFSRIPRAATGGTGKEYVQDRMRTESAGIAALLASPSTHIYICGLRDMESGVEATLADIARQHGRDWSKLKPQMRGEGRYHVETY